MCRSSADDVDWWYGGRSSCDSHPLVSKSSERLLCARQRLVSVHLGLEHGPDLGAQASTHHSAVQVRHYYTRLMALCLGLPGWVGTRKVKNQSGFTGARDSEWQWHKLRHMQICTLTHMHKHASIPGWPFICISCVPVCRQKFQYFWHGFISGFILIPLLLFCCCYGV